jgi:carboxypeptidase Q
MINFVLTTALFFQDHRWAVDNYTSCGIPARNEQWGEWRASEQDVTHIDLLSPRVRSLEDLDKASQNKYPLKGAGSHI